VSFLVDQLIDTYSDCTEEISFLLEQLQLQAVQPRGRRYSPLLIRRSLEIFLSSRSTYRIMRNLLALPHSMTLVGKLGRIGEVGTDKECRATIQSVFSKLSIGEKHCIILFDEMYVKPSIRFRGGHIVGYSEDNPEEVAKTILVIMVKPMFGKPAFVCRLFLVYHLSVSFLKEALENVVKTLYEEEATVLALISDNHPTNRAVYSTFNQGFDKPWLGEVLGHRLVLLQDPVHLFKSFRNNWMSEKNGELQFKQSDHSYLGRWKDIVALYDSESNKVAKTTTLTLKSVRPSNIEKQSVQHMVAVFNEKTIAALKLLQCNETAQFLEKVIFS